MAAGAAFVVEMIAIQFSPREGFNECISFERY